MGAEAPHRIQILKTLLQVLSQVHATLPRLDGVTTITTSSCHFYENRGEDGYDDTLGASSTIRPWP